MRQKIMMLEVNWEMKKAHTTFFEGADAFQKAEADLNRKEKDSGPDWSRSLFFGPMEVGGEQA